MSKIIIRQATIEDLPLVVSTALRAVVDEDPKQSGWWDLMMDVCSREDTLYSWKNALVAECDGVKAGSIISYPGVFYMEKRDYTFALFGNDATPSTEYETNESEYYLDSLMVLPDFRGQGIGSALMNAAIEKAQNEGFDRITLIVSDEKPRNRAMYERLGFKALSPILFLGEPYTKMVYHGTAGTI